MVFILRKFAVFLLFFCQCIFHSNQAFANLVTDGDWQGPIRSIPSQGLAGTGVTDPIAYDLPDWSRAVKYELSHLLNNSAQLPLLDEKRSRLYPIAVQTESYGSAFGFSNHLFPPYVNASELRRELQGLDNKPQYSRLSAYTTWMQQDTGYVLYYSQRRAALLSANGNLEYLALQDFGYHMSISGKIINSDTLGDMGFGIGLKALYRRGDIFQAGTDVNNSEISTKWGAMKKNVFGVGADFSMLYSKKLTDSDQTFQFGFSWRDIGQTNTNIGPRPSNSSHYPIMSNNQTVGIGWGLPKIRDGIRSALRVEYSQWERDIPFYEKVAASYEFRLPVMFHFGVGVAGFHRVSGGIGFRSPGVIVEAATFEELYRVSGGLESQRSFALEIKSEF